MASFKKKNYYGSSVKNGLERKVKLEVRENTRRYQNNMSKRWWCFWRREAAREVERIGKIEAVFWTQRFGG